MGRGLMRRLLRMLAGRTRSRVVLRLSLTRRIVCLPRLLLMVLRLRSVFRSSLLLIVLRRSRSLLRSPGVLLVLLHLRFRTIYRCPLLLVIVLLLTRSIFSRPRLLLVLLDLRLRSIFRSLLLLVVVLRPRNVLRVASCLRVLLPLRRTRNSMVCRIRVFRTVIRRRLIYVRRFARIEGSRPRSCSYRRPAMVHRGPLLTIIASLLLVLNLHIRRFNVASRARQPTGLKLAAPGRRVARRCN